MKLRTLIIEDELPAQKILKAYINDVPSLELIGCFSSALEAMPMLQGRQVDLLLLDINLPKISGLEFLKSLSARPKVIFTTAYPDFAIEGFELAAVDYLLKPFSLQRFIQAVGKALPVPGQSELRASAANNSPKPDHFFIKKDKMFYRINMEEILYLKSERDFVRILATGQKHLVLQSLKYYEEILPPNDFIRVHKSYIIRLDKVDVVFGNTVRIADADIPVGRSYRKDLINRLNLHS